MKIKRGMDALAEVVTLIEMFLPPLSTESTLKGRNLLPRS